MKSELNSNRVVMDFSTAAQIIKQRCPKRYALLTASLSELFDNQSESFRKLGQQAFKVIVICLARIALRHGRGADVHYQYHDEVHALDLMARLRTLYAFTGARCFLPEERLWLAMFAAGHDLQHGQHGFDHLGIGLNERASAAELWEIMSRVGFDYDRQPACFELLRLMVYGTTFYLQPFCYRGRRYPGGALAPALSAEIQDQQPHWQQDPVLTQQVLLIPLAADIDTANVADDFVLYTERCARLCREVLALKGITVLDAAAAPEVYQFLTVQQPYYFFELQTFHSLPARECFSSAKQHNGVLLQNLLTQLKSRYQRQIEADDQTLSGEAILNFFLEQAKVLHDEVALTTDNTPPEVVDEE